jgi:hypothetical protein
MNPVLTSRDRGPLSQLHSRLNASLVGCAVAWLPLLAVCSSSQGQSHAAKQGAASGPDAGAVSLEIRVVNHSERVQYLNDPGFWLQSDSAQFKTFDIGGPSTTPALSLYTALPGCDAIVSGSLSCGQLGDRSGSVLALGPGAEYRGSWNGRVFQRHDLAGSPGCQCVDPVAAPSGTYWVRFGVGSEARCFEPSCPCLFNSVLCESAGAAVVDRRLEGSFAWPEQRAIAFEIPSN